MTIMGGFGASQHPPQSRNGRLGDVIDTDGTEPHGEL
jgi:hypothetical protein